MSESGDKLPAGWMLLGYISGVHGVKGWVKVFSHTDPRENILSYAPWQMRRKTGPRDAWQSCEVLEGRRHGKLVVAHLKGIDDRDQAAELIGTEIAISCEQLPDTRPGEYYWADLEGLEVVTREGRKLGRVDHLMETGVHDVLVVKGEEDILIPYVPDRVVLDVDLEAGRMVVDWDPDY